MLLPISLLSMRTDLPDILKWIEDVENMSFYGFTDCLLEYDFCLLRDAKYDFFYLITMDF